MEFVDETVDDVTNFKPFVENSNILDKMLEALLKWINPDNIYSLLTD